MIPLKEAIEKKHKQAERLAFNTRMFNGELSKDEYAFYLTQQRSIFEVIEGIGLPNEHLNRMVEVDADIEELASDGHAVDQVLPATQSYVDYLAPLSYQEILPHVYLNYMAIMFGGQMMKKSVPSTGRMYDFENMKECIQSIRMVQKDEWADEVNKGFDFIIAIFEELEAECTIKNLAVS